MNTECDWGLYYVTQNAERLEVRSHSNLSIEGCNTVTEEGNTGTASYFYALGTIDVGVRLAPGGVLSTNPK